MTARRLSIEDVDDVAALLASGAVTAIPTDTVYGVAASLQRPASVRRLFALKDRPVTVALPVLISSIDQLEDLGVELNPVAQTLVRALWPGALTIVVTAPRALATTIGASDTVGLRIPDDDRLQRVLTASGPLAVTSANAHGSPPCHDVDEVLAAFGTAEDLDVVVDGGRCDGAVSTVVDLSEEPWRILRPGAISPERIAAILA